MDEAPLASRTILITGASSGIGEHFARRLAAAGGRVVLTARRADRIEEVAEELREVGHDAYAVPCDVTDEKSLIAAFDEAEARTGPVDTVIANAGVTNYGRSTDLAATALQATIDTNFTGLFLTCREAARRMIAAGSRESERGRIVLIGSITAEMTGGGDAAYAATKAGVAHLGRQFAREWIRQGINVNTVQPGYIRTELTGGFFDTEAGRAQIAGWHRRRLLPIDALDEVVMFLCSDTSRHVTGGTFTVDDGQSL